MPCDIKSLALRLAKAQTYANPLYSLLLSYSMYSFVTHMFLVITLVFIPLIH